MPPVKLNGLFSKKRRINEDLEMVKDEDSSVLAADEVGDIAKLRTDGQK